VRRVTNRYNETLNGYFLCDRGRFGAGFLNSPARFREARDRAGGVLTRAAARSRLAAILAEGDVIGIGSPRASVESNFALQALEAISESMRNVCGGGLDGRARCDSGQVFEALPETSCGRRPPARSIAVRGYAMEVT
jgi:predicted molibdopterin-dependent oxidoreductase YjgC